MTLGCTPDTAQDTRRTSREWPCHGLFERDDRDSVQRQSGRGHESPSSRDSGIWLMLRWPAILLLLVQNHIQRH